MQVNGHKVELGAWIRFSVQILLLVLAVLTAYFRLDNRVAAVELQTLQAEKTIQEMDKNGTHRSHEMDTGQQSQIDETIRRVGNIESALRDLVPKVERIDTNVLVLMSREKKT